MLGLLLAAPLCAEPPALDEGETLERVVVVASRIAEPVSQVVGSVSIIERDDMDIHRVQDIGDLMRYEPGVAVIGDASRFGLQGYSIRGLEGNRVRMELDGVPLGDGFTIGSFSSAGRDMVDVAVLERVEVLRGPASTLYGSDALAGIVAYRTRTPEDLISRVDGNSYSALDVDYSGRDSSHLVGATWAGQSGPWQALFWLGQRSGNETANNARDARHDANPRDFDRASLLAKLYWDGDAAGEWSLTLDEGRSKATGNLLSMVAGPGQFASTEKMTSADRDDRRRVSVAHDWSPQQGPVENLQSIIYTQRSQTRQHAQQWRGVEPRTPYPTLRIRDFDLDQRADGLRVMGQSRASTGALEHWHVFGVEYARIRYEELRDGVQVNLDTGASTPVIIGEHMPVRDFPNSTSRGLGVFWQDEISAGRWAVVPGVRWQRDRLDAYPDDIFREDNPGIEPANRHSTSVTPKLGARVSLGKGSSLFAQYAEGYRAPPFSDVNVAFTIPAFNYRTLPNPDLRAEKSRGLEVGFRQEGPTRSLQLSGYENRYRDLIETRAQIGIDPDSGALLFQSINRDRARIHGVELSLAQQLGCRYRGNWSLHAAGAWARGDDTARNQPLNTVLPAHGVLGLRYQADEWGAELVGTAVARQTRIDTSVDAMFQPPGYGLLDLYAWYEPMQRLRVHAGVVNLGDRRYWEWRSARNITPSAGDQDFFTAPGRYVTVGANLYW